MKISATDKELPEEVYCEAIEAICAMTKMFLHHVERWIFTKDRPDLGGNPGSSVAS